MVLALALSGMGWDQYEMISMVHDIDLPVFVGLLCNYTISALYNGCASEEWIWLGRVG